MIKKYYQLNKWEKAKHWDDVLTFQKIDWMYAHWKNEAWDLVVGHYDSYEYEPKLWYYLPINN